MENHGLESVQEDIDPPMMESNDVDPMQEDLLNEIYKNTTDVSSYYLKVNTYVCLMLFISYIKMK